MKEKAAVEAAISLLGLSGAAAAGKPVEQQLLELEEGQLKKALDQLQKEQAEARSSLRERAVLCTALDQKDPAGKSQQIQMVLRDLRKEIADLRREETRRAASIRTLQRELERVRKELKPYRTAMGQALRNAKPLKK